MTAPTDHAISNSSSDRSNGPITRARASLGALEVLDRLKNTGKPPTSEDLAALEAWSGWGPMAPALEFHRKGTWAEIGERISFLLPPAAYREGEQATPNAF